MDDFIIPGEEKGGERQVVERVHGNGSADNKCVCVCVMTKPHPHQKAHIIGWFFSVFQNGDMRL